LCRSRSEADDGNSNGFEVEASPAEDRNKRYFEEERLLALFEASPVRFCTLYRPHAVRR